jgi:hypothetical protein
MATSNVILATHRINGEGMPVYLRQQLREGGEFISLIAATDT